MKTVKHECKLIFQRDNGVEIKIIDIITPENQTHIVEKELEKGHKFLCEKDKEDLCVASDQISEALAEDFYGTLGRTPETLAMYVCEKNGWAFKVHEPDICLVFD